MSIVSSDIVTGSSNTIKGRTIDTTGRWSGSFVWCEEGLTLADYPLFAEGFTLGGRKFEHSSVHRGYGNESPGGDTDDCLIYGKFNKVIMGTKNNILGKDNEVTGTENLVLGRENKVKGNRNIVIGNSNEIEGDDQIIIGHHKMIGTNLMDEIEKLRGKLELLEETIKLRPGGEEFDEIRTHFETLSESQ